MADVSLFGVIREIVVELFSQALYPKVHGATTHTCLFEKWWLRRALQGLLCFKHACQLDKDCVALLVA